MNNQPLIFERIVWGDLRPWLESNRNEEKFASITGELKLTEPLFQQLYGIEFYSFFSDKTRYYHKLITNEADNFCNRVTGKISKEEDTRIIKYLISGTFKKLKTLLKDVARLIKANDFDLKYINPYKSGFDTDTDHKSDTFIIQLLKTALIKVYLEIQEVFKTYISSDDYIRIEVLYLQYLNEPIPEKTFLKLQTVIPIGHADAKAVTKDTGADSTFIPISFKYKKSATNPDALKDLWDSLKNYSLIDNKTTLNDFKRVFSGKEIKNPVRWTGNASEFYWFIHLIYVEYKFVEDLKQQQWKVAVQCFVRIDDTCFDIYKLRNMKRPKLTGELLEKAVKLLK